MQNGSYPYFLGKKSSHTANFSFSFSSLQFTKQSLTLSAASHPQQMSPSLPRVDLAKQGTVEGELDPSKRVVQFLNIPYATVQERWRPAIKPESWSGIRDATKQGYA